MPNNPQTTTMPPEVSAAQAMAELLAAQLIAQALAPLLVLEKSDDS